MAHICNGWWDPIVCSLYNTYRAEPLVFRFGRLYWFGNCQSLWIYVRIFRRMQQCFFSSLLQCSVVSIYTLYTTTNALDHVNTLTINTICETMSRPHQHIAIRMAQAHFYQKQNIILMFYFFSVGNVYIVTFFADQLHEFPFLFLRTKTITKGEHENNNNVITFRTWQNWLNK